MSEHDEYYPWFMKMNYPISKEKTNTSLVTDVVKKKLFLFDVDGTIVPSGKCISNEMKNVIKRIINTGNHVGIVGGGSIEKIKVQMRDLMFHHYFTECGCIYHKNQYLEQLDCPHNYENEQLILSKIYSHNIREHKIYPQINILMKECMKYVSSVKYCISGNLMDLRNGIVYFSMVGMPATEKEREDFIVEDNIYSHRRILITILKEKAAQLGIYKQVCIYEGGQVGIAIFPREYDKVQVIDHIEDVYNCIYYFGDKYEENGNDHMIINDPRIIGFAVNSPDETFCILSDLLNMYDKQNNENKRNKK